MLMQATLMKFNVTKKNEAGGGLLGNRNGLGVRGKGMGKVNMC